MADSVPEVLFETRRHASLPFSPNSPPNQLQLGPKGGFFSLISSQGLNQLKEIWRQRNRARVVTSWASLFVSPRGEYVAVATGNQITILHKDDNYMDPSGVFSSDEKKIIFTYGAWLDSHGVLGVIDDANTLYFIKSNGMEIARMTGKQYGTGAQIMGLTVREDPDACSSSLSGFNILMSDGLLHRVEITEDSSRSVSFLPATDTRPDKFPQNISCFDFHPEFRFLVLVTAVDSVLNNSQGLFCLYLLRISQDCGLELLFCSPHFEGAFSTPRGNAMPFTAAKVATSPMGKHVATLDMTGNMHIFFLDAKSCTLSIFASGKKHHSKNDDFLSGFRKYLSEITDFTWWSDHILIVAKKNGLVTMFDVIAGAKSLEDDLTFSMPVLERVQKCNGCVFLLENSTSGGRSVCREVMDAQNVEHTAGDLQEDSRMCWSLLSFSERSVSEMYTVLIRNQKYQVAFEFASRHGLDRDEVFKSQWLHSNQGTREINMLLSNIKDKKFVLSQCLNKIGATEDSVRALLSYGIHVTDQYRVSDSEDDKSSLIWHYRMVRLQLLQYRDRLETFVGINMGRFSMLDYAKFRTIPLNEAAITIAESGKIGALNLLFKRHPYSLAPFILNILACIPETVPVQTYSQLLPGRYPPNTVSLRERDWVECEKMINFVVKVSKNYENNTQIRTEYIVKQHEGLVWPSVKELSLWYKHRAREIDSLSGQLDNCLSMVKCACDKGVPGLQQFYEDVLYLSQLIYSDLCDDKINFSMSLVAWEELADYDKFKMMLTGVKEDIVVGRLLGKAIPFMRSRSCQTISGSVDFSQTESFLVQWLKEISQNNKLDLCLMVIEEGGKNFQHDGMFKDVLETIEVTLQCIYLCGLTNHWNSMASMLSKLPPVTAKGNFNGYLQSASSDKYVESLERRLKLAEGHVEAGRLLAYYQVPKPMSFFLEASSDEKSVKQLLRLILSKFGRKQPGKSDNEWTNMWRDMQCLQEKAFPFLDTEYMLMEFCRGLLKAGKFSLARNYLKGTGTITLAAEKAENLVIQAAREFFFSASSLTSAEIWKAKECLNIFPTSKNIKAETDVIDALTVRLPNLGVTLLPMQYRQIRNPMEIINMVVMSETATYYDVDELIEIAKLLGLTSQDDISAVQEVVAREAAVSGDMQLAYDLCILLAKKGHGPVWDLCAAIARGPALDNMDTSSRKQLLGFALSHCDDESIGELLHAWKDLDSQFQFEKLMTCTDAYPPEVSLQDASFTSPSRDCSHVVEGSARHEGSDNDQICFRNIKRILSMAAKDTGFENGTSLDSLLLEDRKFLSFASSQLPWLLEFCRKDEYGSKGFPGVKLPGRQYMSVRTQAILSIISWLARNDLAPQDELVASLAKSVMEPPVAEEDDIIACSFLLNLFDAIHGVQVIEEQLKTRKEYPEICSIMDLGMKYSSLHSAVLNCSSPAQRRELLLHKFQQKNATPRSNAMNNVDKEQRTFWKEWKSRLLEQKMYADQTRALEQIMPGVEASRFLSGDIEYIKGAVFSFVDSAKLEKKPILKEVLKLADAYGLSRIEVLLQYLANAFTSEIWRNDDITAELSEYKEEMLGSAAAVVNMVSSVVFPAIDGCNKLRLAYVYDIFSECFSQLESSNETPLTGRWHLPCKHNKRLSQYYELLEQECRRVSFIKSLNFKNIAGLGDLNFEKFNDEVYSHICESNVEVLAKMVKALAGIYNEAASEGLLSWQDVYKHHVLSLMETLEMATKLKLHPVNADVLGTFISKLEQNYDCCRIYIRSMSDANLLEIMGKYYGSSVPHFCSECCLSGEEIWSDCLISLLKFWVRLADEVQEILSENGAIASLSKYLKIFQRLVMQGEVSACQGWGTVSSYVKHVTADDYTAGIPHFCEAMVFSGCGFKAIAEIFAHATVATSANSTNVTEESIRIEHLIHFYLNMTDLVLMELDHGSADSKKLHNLLSSLSKLIGDLEDLRRVRYAVWGRLTEFSDNMQLPSHIRVYALEFMQSVAGINLRGLPAEFVSEIQLWEGWDESHYTLRSSTADNGANVQHDGPSKFTNTLVALRSTQLVSAISANIEITPEDLSTLDMAVSCFLRLFEAASSESHLGVLQAILEEWEVLFTVGKDEVECGETPDAENNWSNCGWDDEGWESFPEEPTEQVGKKEGPGCIHPFHVCWMEIVKKLVKLSQLFGVIKLVDHSLSKCKGTLITEDEAQSLSQLLLGIDCFMALKIMMLFPYEDIWFKCLHAVEAKLKGEGIAGTGERDYELLTVVLSAGVLSTVANDYKHSVFFTHLLHLVGHISRTCQEGQLSLSRQMSKGEKGIDGNEFYIFCRILFPYFVMELVISGQILLAGYLVSHFMHTNTSLKLINVAEASLRLYLEGLAHMPEDGGPDIDKMSVCQCLRHTVSILRVKLKNSLQSALSVLN